MRRKRIRIDKTKLAEKLRNSLPHSEIWFWREWDRAEMRHEKDLSNEIFKGFIPDVINHEFKYIIEINGSIHNRRIQKYIDRAKQRVFTYEGYEVFWLRAYDYKEFGILIDLIEKYRKRILLMKHGRYGHPSASIKPSKTILRKKSCL